MGSDPAPFIANLFLYYYENKWIPKMKKSNLNMQDYLGRLSYL